MRSALRVGYTAKRKATVVTVKGTSKRKGYTYKTKAMTYRVKPRPAADVGALGQKHSVIGKLKAGMLTKYHYHPVETMTKRHMALKKAIRVGREDPHQVIKRLTAISTLTKRTLPNASRIYKRDAKWVHQTYALKFKTKV
jgi:hypothetical protein